MFYLAYVPGINPDFSLSDKLLRRPRVWASKGQVSRVPQITSGL